MVMVRNAPKKCPVCTLHASSLPQYRSSFYPPQKLSWHFENMVIDACKNPWHQKDP